MQTRTSPPGTLEVQAVYSVATLARFANVTRHLMNRVLRANGIAIKHVGRARYVPMSEIRSRIPWLWDSLCDAEEARASRRKATPRLSGASGSSRSSR
jgi:hypothetical protein